jgi:hypothetical protein
MGGPWKDRSYWVPKEIDLSKLPPSVPGRLEEVPEYGTLKSALMMFTLGIVIGAVLVLASAPLWVYWLPIK